MADGFHGMRNDFIEFFNCIVGLSCFPVSNHDDDAQSLLLPAPLTDFSDSDLLGTGAEDRNAPAIEDVPDWSFSGTVSVDDGDDATFPRGEQAENVEGLDSSFSFVREQLCSTSESEENSLNINLNKNDSEFTSSLQIAGEKSTRRRKLKTGWSSKSASLMVSSSPEDAQPTGEGTHFDSSSGTSNWYSYSKKIEDEDVGIQKHFPNQWIMVEDHLPSLERKITRDYHDVDDCEYVILKRP
ncbi:hypothetical protein KSP39_PZI013480 [Platanthera zijinensis]|uniref:Uncharacterized protein n=1 Tax=Platanthera zijinensis TaxID=2320716 RepID=A0AAP0BEB6_9ASPA